MLLFSDYQKIYNRIKDGLLRCDKVINFSVTEINKAKKAFLQVIDDCPEIFYVRSYEMTIGLLGGTMNPQYIYSISDIKKTSSQIKMVTTQIIAGYENKSDSDKEMYVHDYICRNVRYVSQNRSEDYSLVGTLLYRQGVCEGIAKMAKHLFNCLHVESFFISGKSKNPQSKSVENHAWNIVRVNQAYYHLDITFDLNLSSNGYIRYDYFNLGDTEIKKDHQFKEIKNIVCQDNNNYYAKKNLIMKTPDLLKGLIRDTIQNNQRTLTFKMPSGFPIDETLKKIEKILSQTLTNIQGISQYNISYNATQYIFSITLS